MEALTGEVGADGVIIIDRVGPYGYDTGTETGIGPYLKRYV